jgi:PhoPQ-activated pathogenicity-related protein
MRREEQRLYRRGCAWIERGPSSIDDMDEGFVRMPLSSGTAGVAQEKR